MANKNNKKRGRLVQLFESYGADTTPEIKQLIDLAIRKQLDAQEVVQRFVNTKYFRKQFPGLVENDGTIANALSGQQGAPVSIQNLQAAVANYRKALEQYGQEAQKYGVKFSRTQLAAQLRNDTSFAEYRDRLNAISTVNANPAAATNWEAQVKALGLKPSKQDLYRAASGYGDRRFRTLYEATQLQTQAGLGAEEALGLARDRSISPAASFEDVNNLIAEVRQNMQGYLPELNRIGINPAKLVKVLGNPAAFVKEIGDIRAIAEQRQALHGRPVVGSYAQQGPGGGLSQYPARPEQAYG